MNRSFRGRYLLLALAALTGCADEFDRLVADMDASQTIPLAVSITRGSATFSVDGSVVSFVLNVEDLTSFVWAAHIHSGPPSKNGTRRFTSASRG